MLSHKGNERVFVNNGLVHLSASLKAIISAREICNESILGRNNVLRFYINTINLLSFTVNKCPRFQVKTRVYFKMQDDAQRDGCILCSLNTYKNAMF